MKTTLVVLTLNEIEGIKIIMPKIKKEWVDQIIILDGGSIDGTVEWAIDNGYFVYEQKKRGLRHAYTEVMDYIEGDIFIPFSPDGNSIPEMIPPMIEKMKEGFDMVTVSRYLDGAKSDDDDYLTAFGNWFFTKTINFLHHGKYTDGMVMYRGIKKDVFFQLDLHKDESYSLEEKIFRTTVCIMPLLSVRAAKKGLKVCEIPGDEPSRIGGERKLKLIQWGGAYYFQFIRELWFWK